MAVYTQPPPNVDGTTIASTGPSHILSAYRKSTPRWRNAAMGSAYASGNIGAGNVYYIDFWTPGAAAVLTAEANAQRRLGPGTCLIEQIGARGAGSSGTGTMSLRLRVNGASVGPSTLGWGAGDPASWQDEIFNVQVAIDDLVCLQVTGPTTGNATLTDVNVVVNEGFP